MAESTESSTVVPAPPTAVLAVITDLPAYPEWANGVRSVEVLSTGTGKRPARARFVVDSGPIKDTYVLDYTYALAEDGTGTVSWTLVESAVMTKLDGTYALTADGDGTQVSYRLAVDLTLPMLGMLKRKAEKRIVDTALKELAQRVAG